MFPAVYKPRYVIAYVRRGISFQIVSVYVKHQLHRTINGNQLTKNITDYPREEFDIFGANYRFDKFTTNMPRRVCVFGMHDMLNKTLL